MTLVDTLEEKLAAMDLPGSVDLRDGQTLARLEAAADQLLAAGAEAPALSELEARLLGVSATPLGAQVSLKLARSKGYITLSDDGVRRVLEGVTSMDEIARVLDLTEGIQ